MAEDTQDHNSDASSDVEDVGGGLFDEPDEWKPKTPPPTFATHALSLSPESSITVRLIGKSPLWGHFLWNAARITCNYIESSAESLVRGKTVLEFGAGAGLPSLLCAALGAKAVTITDYPDADLIQNIEYNKLHSLATSSDEAGARNEDGLKKMILPESTTIHCAGYIWGAPADPILAVSPKGYDLCILSDLLFNHSQHEALVQSLKLTLAKPDGVALVFFTPHRPWLYEKDLNFFKLVRETGEMEVEEVMQQKLEKPMLEEPRGDQSLLLIVFGYKVTWKKDST
ncbi:nicotinamide n-methyltransferase [Orbilia blumenaviensis]|uniref:Protein N-terminal and lysine N-methyltransferase EFM7 n=1 Tax=Orbilia blumenaviensis TaxID=1796055 RepID=A0AAV9TZT0_9PEZI